MNYEKQIKKATRQMLNSKCSHCNKKLLFQECFESRDMNNCITQSGHTFICDNKKYNAWFYTVEPLVGDIQLYCELSKNTSVYEGYPC